MRGPEVKQYLPNVLEVSAELAYVNAFTLASRNNTNIGLRHLFEGVRDEIGDYLVVSDARRKKLTYIN